MRKARQHCSSRPPSAVLMLQDSAVDSGAHAATNSLHSLTWPPQGSTGTAPSAGEQAHSSRDKSSTTALDVPLQTIVDVVQRPKEAGGFPGLYCGTMASQPWLLPDKRTLLLATAWRSTQAIVAVHVETGEVVRISPAGPVSWSLLDVCEDVVIAAASTPSSPPKLMIGRRESNAESLQAGEPWLWSEISSPHVEYAQPVEAALKAMDFKVISIPVPVATEEQQLSEGAKQAIEAVYVSQQTTETPSTNPAPLLVVPHGGPHSCTPTSFMMPYAFLAALGFSILHVNYRGSTGFGEEALQSLPGNIGRQDVDDVLAALDEALALGFTDGKQVAVVGGSHGGFLAAHLIGQAPDRFRTGVLRNPVVNLVSMVPTSDIPDWCFTEALGAAGVAAYSETPSAAEIEAFAAVSPIKTVSKVKVPTLFLLSGADQRVPFSNGIQMVHALRARGLESEVIFFPEDSHATDLPQSEFEAWLTAALWLKKHLQVGEESTV
eukprot:TRINITY_DN26929_c0_g1_i1.p1 TRINITY_DN26929_c0_g1~~TRINITY_DN26929_c0_g1_i1.p1  ORF type:complete len:492 (+),score=83.27 TRINITY_DN26929_c0_g1_i1:1278-2753(+)